MLEKKRNKLVLIGNGFDLAHGLNSSYSDFLVWWIKDEIRKASLNTKHRVSDAILFNVQVFPESILELSSNFEESLETFLSQFNTISDFVKSRDVLIETYVDGKNKQLKLKIKYSNDFFKNLLDYDLWKDIESSYFETILTIFASIADKMDKKNSLIIPNDAFTVIKSKLAEFLKIELEKSDKKLKKQIEELIIYCEEIDLTERQKEMRRVIAHDTDSFYTYQLNNVKYINFNYTSVLDWYVSKISNSKERENIINIHGHLNYPDSIVFGYGDEMNKEFREIEETGIDEYLVNFKSNFYGQNHEYFQLLQTMKTPFDVIVIGHSLGLSDRLLLNTIFEHENCKYIHLQYRGGNTGHFRKRLALSRHFDDKKKLRDRLFPMNSELDLSD